ncbi:hypothetical protein [Simkania sp.]|uniref:hypothetical protein n=1 Tax=Simkania sp. TaxID=34094 RepID=UPI003B5206D9
MSKALDFSAMDSAAIEKFVNSVPQNLFKKFGRFFILPAMSSTEEFVAAASKMEQVAKKGAEFKGNFKLRSDFGQFKCGNSISFNLLDREITVGRMKDQISALTGVPVNEIRISFQNLFPIRDDFSLHTDLNCNGNGGENFWLTRVPSSDSKRAE